MPKTTLALLLCIICPGICWQTQAAQEIRLIVRGDDIGSSHAANIACIQCYKEVQAAIQKNGIRLISYKDIKEGR